MSEPKYLDAQGMPVDPQGLTGPHVVHLPWWCGRMDQIVQAAIDQAVAEEREACARVVEGMCGDHLPHECAAPIRARGKS